MTVRTKHSRARVEQRRQWEEGQRQGQGVEKGRTGSNARPVSTADSVPLETDTNIPRACCKLTYLSVLDAQREGLQSIDLGNFYAPKLN